MTTTNLLAFRTELAETLAVAVDVALALLDTRAGVEYAYDTMPALDGTMGPSTLTYIVANMAERARVGNTHMGVQLYRWERFTEVQDNLSKLALAYPAATAVERILAV